MQRCCIPDCESYKYTDTVSITYFKFPLHNEAVCEKWLKQIDRKNWYPSNDDMVCSMHSEFNKCNYLKPVKISTILPFEQIFLPSTHVQTNSSTQLNNGLKWEKHIGEGSSPLMMQSPSTGPKSLNHSTNGSGIVKLSSLTQTQKKKLVATCDVNTSMDSKSNIKVSTINNISSNAIKTENKIVKKVPVLKITINKKYNKPCMLGANQRKSIVANTIDVTCKTKKINSNKEMEPNEKNHEESIVSPKPIIFNVVPVLPEKPMTYSNIAMDTTNLYMPKTAYTRKGDLSRDNSRTQTSAERIRYLYTKAQRDCDILKIRLKALRERHNQEEEEIKKLEMHLGNLDKDDTKEFCNDVSEGNMKRKRLSVHLGDIEKEDECKRLLTKVRKIRQDLLEYPVTLSNSVLNHESSKIKQSFPKFIENISKMNVMQSDERNHLGPVLLNT